MGTPIFVTHDRAPGDICVATSCIHSLATTYPGKYDIHVGGRYPELWAHNPHIISFSPIAIKDVPQYTLDYGRFIRESNTRKIHFINAMHLDLARHLGTTVPVVQPRPALYLDEWHQQNRPIDGRYWFILAGGKNDFTVKISSTVYWQTIVDTLLKYHIRCVQGGAVSRNPKRDGRYEHCHPPLANTLNLAGCTSLRDMLWLIKHADGIICPITAAMHMAAAFERPCVVLAGGREAWWWEGYVNAGVNQFGPECPPVRVPHRYLHTLG